MNPVSWVKDSISSTANTTPGHPLAQQLDQPGRHLGGHGLELEDLHGRHVDDHGTVRADAERAQAGAFGHVPGDPGRPAGDGDDVEARPLRRLDGVDGALADGAVGAQQGPVEVGGDQSDRGPRTRRRRLER